MLRIDAAKQLKPEDIKTFLQNADNEIEVVINDKIHSLVRNKHELLEYLLSLDNLTDDMSVVCKSTNVYLVLAGLDINWWKQNARRYNKLYKAADEVLSAIPKPVYTLAIATLVDGQLTQVNVLSGTKENATKALNEDIKNRYIDSFLKAKIVINLAYQQGDENDMDAWLTLDELKDIGAITLA